VKLGVRVFFKNSPQDSDEFALDATAINEIKVQQNPHGFLIGTSKVLVSVPKELVWSIDAIQPRPQDLKELIDHHFDTHQLDILLTCLREGVEGASPFFTHTGEARAILAQLTQLRKNLQKGTEEKEA
jgi:hypothetical protein